MRIYIEQVLLNVKDGKVNPDSIDTNEMLAVQAISDT